MYDGRAAYHVRRFPRPSPSVFAYWKRSKAGGVEGLGTRLTIPCNWFGVEALKEWSVLNIGSQVGCQSLQS